MIKDDDADNDDADKVEEDNDVKDDGFVEERSKRNITCNSYNEHRKMRHS